ncbi:MAG: sulfatase-like hydrolase/transferase, partial [Planctomycetes bacterium]|nr:sulfatase-like hydrolase/transferase [Planctomycetota bacterium]
MKPTPSRLQCRPSSSPSLLPHGSATLILALSAAVLSIVPRDKARARQTDPPPNLVIILADDLGYGDLSCYGGTAFRTPHLDALSAEGMRLVDFHSSGPVCSPTRAGLVTGRYQQRAGVPGVIFADPKQNRHHGLHTEEVTFAELL